MYPPNTTNPEFSHEWVTYKAGADTFGRAAWLVCKKCGVVMRSDGKVERCLPQAPLQNHSPLRREGAFV